MKKLAIYFAIGFILLLIMAGADPGLLLALGIVITFCLWLRKTTSSHMLKHSMQEIDIMSGDDFEHYVAKLLTRIGYKAEVTQLSGDYGADVVADRMYQNKPERTVVQCKRYQSKVGISAVQEIVAAKAHYKAQKAMVVTNNYFTDAAKNLAMSNKVILWDREMLETQIYKAKGKCHER